MRRQGTVWGVLHTPHTYTHSLTHTHTHSHTLTLSHTHSLSPSHTHTHSLSHTLSLSHTHTHSLCLTHTHTPTLSLSHTHTHTLSLSHTRTHPHTLSLSHTHTHTHTPSRGILANCADFFGFTCCQDRSSRVDWTKTYEIPKNFTTLTSEDDNMSTNVRIPMPYSSTWDPTQDSKRSAGSSLRSNGYVSSDDDGTLKQQFSASKEYNI